MCIRGVYVRDDVPGVDLLLCVDTLKFLEYRPSIFLFFVFFTELNIMHKMLDILCSNLSDYSQTLVRG